MIGGWLVQIHGRVDGLSSEGGRPVIEELKSAALDRTGLWRTRLEDWPEFAAQLRVYLWMLSRRGQPEAVGRLVLLSVLDGSRHVLGVAPAIEATEERVHRTLERWVAEREDRIAWMQERQRWSIPWPYPQQRPGQGSICAQVSLSLGAGRPLFVQAPTGLGKTAPVLIATLRHALATGRQVLWLTARTTHQEVALQTARDLLSVGAPLRVVVITAREKACLMETVDCRAEVCPFAERYHDKLAAEEPQRTVLDPGPADPMRIREISEQIQVCPYQLAVDAARRADLVIADYNYVFDPDVAGSTLFGEEPSGWTVIVDEAHQLIERGRGYGSPSLCRRTCARSRDALARAGEALAGVARLAEDIEEQIALEIRSSLHADQTEALCTPDRGAWAALARRIDTLASDYALLRLQHPELLGDEDPWTDLARAVLRFSAVLERAGPETVGISEPDAVRLLCLDPSGLLGARLASLGGFVGCSATLTPVSFYRDLMGIPPETLDVLDVPSPFPAALRKVLVAPRVSTRFADREAHRERIARLVVDLLVEIPGNVAVFTSSFAVLHELFERVIGVVEDRECLLQQPGMAEDARRRFVARLRSGGRPVVLGAVLGGIFAEGIDLPGDALLAVIVIGPGLPPVGLERDLLRHRYQSTYGQGFAYASLIPGMTKVIQASGRVVRGPTDRGCVVLVGQRFRWRDFAGMLPQTWEVEIPDDPVRTLRAFFASLPDSDAVEGGEE